MTEVEAQGKLEMLHDCKMASAIPNRNLWSYLSSLLRLPPPNCFPSGVPSLSPTHPAARARNPGVLCHSFLRFIPMVNQPQEDPASFTSKTALESGLSLPSPPTSPQLPGEAIIVSCLDCANGLLTTNGPFSPRQPACSARRCDLIPSRPYSKPLSDINSIYNKIRHH